MKKKILSFMLSLAMLSTIVIPNSVAYAADTDDGLNISKTAAYNKADNSYTITLEAYATGEFTSTTVKEDIPTDIILVLDASGSMSSKMSTVSYRAYTNKQNSNFYSKRHNGGDENLWYKDGNKYYSVSVLAEEKLDQPTQLGSLVNDTSTDYPWSLTSKCYYYYANNLYEKVGDSYEKVTLTKSGDWWNGYTYTYKFSDGTSVTSSDGNSLPNLGSHAPLYTATVDSTQTVYTYIYTDGNGNQQTIGTSVGASTNFTEATLYERVTSTSGITRLSALKNAVNGFANSVAEKAKGADGQYGTSDDVNHRIAVVRFTSSARDLTNGLVDMDSARGLTTVTNAVNGLQAGGDTAPATGLNTANGIFSNNPVEAGKRNRVIVLFTDGYPAENGTDNINYTWCDNAITSANTSKNTYGATVYTVGIFDGANPDSDINTNFEYGNRQSSEINRKQLVAANRYMHYTSSNFPNATSLQNGGGKTGNGYYLSAADADTLNNIFQQISGNISEGGSTTKLDESAVIRDIVAPAFEMPANAEDVKLYTAESNGSANSWKARQSFDGNVTIDPDTSAVSVSGFSFKDNWCGNETIDGQARFHDGKKIIIEFTVKPKAGFLGGNDVYTNTNAGIYENDSAATPIKEFEKPQVNVPIKDVTVDAKDKNVYLKGSVTADQLKSDATVKVGNVDLKLNEPNYGLESWQTEYVNITVKITDKDGKTFNAGDLTGLTEDKDFTVTVTVSPKTTEPKSTEGTKAEEQSGSSEGKINVFKPELTFKDSTAYYGDTAPTDSSGNLTNTEWKHGETKSTDSGVTMIGTAPTLDLTYTPEAGKIAGGKINTKEDISVDVSVKIGTDDVTDETSFVHTKCDETCTDPANGKFWIHVKTCTLSITKQGGAVDESYVFDVLKDGEKYSEVTVWGNGTETLVELPVGDYTIVENTGWSWRYSANNGGSAALTAQSPTGSITCTNTKTNDQWLNGFSTVVRNIFGFKH
ncbi:MAG: vWA domain-containing protein [Candidatus Limivicinus sp.]|nr:vWA domain-containing protein [Candidatus Limivicinus sp.]